MILANPPKEYLQGFFATVLQQISKTLTVTYQKNADVELNADQRLIIVSPNGTRYEIVVDNSGVLSASAV
jgi:hypothetical protein